MANLHVHTPHPRSDPMKNARQSFELAPQADCMPLQNVYQPDVNLVGLYHGMNYNYGQHAQDCDNALYQNPPPTQAVNLDRQYAYDGHLNTDYPLPGNSQDNFVSSGTAHVDHNSPLAHDLPNGGVSDPTPLIPDLENSVSQSVHNRQPSGALARESLRHLADRYLHDPGSRIDTLRLGLSPSGGRLRVMIVFDIDV